jgi:hypothetical protein
MERCQERHRAMSSASSSIETLAFMRRTFDCERTSLLKGMPSDADMGIF